MTDLFYGFVLLNAAVSLAVAAVSWWKNRYQLIGPVFGVAMVLVALWLLGFAQYFRPAREPLAMRWAVFTLAMGTLNASTLFHAMCVYVGKGWRLRWGIAASYALWALLFVLLLQGQLIVGLRSVPYMHHYVRYDRAWYPLLVGHILLWQFGGVAVLARSAYQSTGYKRTQYIYFIIAWFIVFLTTNSVIVPLEYEINIPPFGFFILPLNLVFLAYVMAKARLADYNVAIARVLLHTLTLVIVAGCGLLAVAGLTMLAPGFMNQQQIVFTVMLVTAIGLAIAVVLPRWLPRAERIMQERLFGKRYGYQDALAGLARELSRVPTIDQLLATVATTVHSQMQVSRVLILLQDPLSGQYRLQAQSGLSGQQRPDAFFLREDSAVVRWLHAQQDALVRDELERRLPGPQRREITTELDRLGVDVCVPMLLEERLTGVMAIGPKANREMFFVSDLRLLETLATETALAVRYRRVEDEMFRKNRLVELGTIAAGVAHEIRNPLASIKTFAQLMPDRMDDPEFKNEFSKLVLKDVDRITRVVESMLAFARPAQITIGEHGANELVEEALLLVQPKLKAKRIELVKEFHGQPVLRVDKNQILQVLVNLLSNAADAAPEQGTIRVATGFGSLEDTGDGQRAHRAAIIEVSDNGAGIPAAIRNRLFDPFFTTKKDGTGLGLSISQKIVRDHGGIITVSSVEGQGATFRVKLPLG